MNNDLKKRIVRVLPVFFALLAIGVVPLFAQDTTVHDTPSGTIEFVYWQQDATMEAGWQKIVDGFNQEYPNVEVKLVGATGTNWGEYLDSLATLIAGGEKPDLMWVATEGVQLLVNQLKLAMPLDDYIARDQAELQGYLDDVNPQLLDAFKVDGKQYELPYSWNPMVIYYNTALLKAAGLEPPKADWTRDDFLKYAQALTTTRADGTQQYGYAWDNTGMFVSAMPWIYANGGDVVSDDFCSATVTDPKVEDALQFMHDLIYDYKVSPTPLTLSNIFQSFINGDIAMFGAGRWPLVTLLPTDFRDFDIINWPGNPDQITEFGIDGFPILNTGSNPDGAWAFVKYMTNVSVEQALLGTADSPVGNVPSRLSVADQMNQFPPPNALLYYHVLDGKAKLVPAPPKFNQLENIFIRYTSSIFADESSVADAMNGAQSELSSVVSCSS